MFGERIGRVGSLCLACHRSSTALMRLYRPKQSATGCNKAGFNFVSKLKPRVSGQQFLWNNGNSGIFVLIKAITLSKPNGLPVCIITGKKVISVIPRILIMNKFNFDKV